MEGRIENPYEMLWYDNFRALPDQWDHLAKKRSFFSQRSYLAYSDSDCGGPFALCAIKAGDLVASVPGWITDGKGHPYLEPYILFRELGMPGGSYLILGSPWAFSGELLYHSPRLINDNPLPAMITGLNERARKLGAHGVVGLYLDDFSAGHLRPFSHDGATLLVNFDATIPVPENFAAYLDRFPHRQRRNIKGEIARFRRAGLTCNVESLEVCLEEFAPLVAQNERKHGHDITTERVVEGLSRQLKFYRQSMITFTARTPDGTLIAGAMAVVNAGSVYMRLYGMDTSRTDNNFEYFNVGYYEPIRYAIRKRLQYVRLGLEGTVTKLLRGGRLEPRWAVDLTGLWSKSCGRQWNDKKLREVSNLVAQHSWAFDSDWYARLHDMAARQL